jgi:hypothetical protein
MHCCNVCTVAHLYMHFCYILFFLAHFVLHSLIQQLVLNYWYFKSFFADLVSYAKVWSLLSICCQLC